MPRHWRRNVGRMVKVGPITGRVVQVDDRGVMLDVAGELTLIAHESLGAGRVQVEFNRVDETAEDELEDFEAADGDDDADEDDDEDGLEDEER